MKSTILVLYLTLKKKSLKMSRYQLCVGCNIETLTYLPGEILKEDHPGKLKPIHCTNTNNYLKYIVLILIIYLQYLVSKLIISKLIIYLQYLVSKLIISKLIIYLRYLVPILIIYLQYLVSILIIYLLYLV